MHSKECQDLGECKYFGLADVFIVIFREAEEIWSMCSNQSSQGIHGEGPTPSAVYGEIFIFHLLDSIFLLSAYVPWDLFAFWPLSTSVEAPSIP